MAILSTYSGRNVFGALSNLALNINIPIAGIAAQGIAQITVRMTVTQSVLQVGMDGAVIPSVVPGDQGEIEIQVWQTSTIHQSFLAWYNALKAARDAGNVQPWYSSALVLQGLPPDTWTHYCTGVAPAKIPDKSYAEQAGRVSWVLVAANITSEPI